MSRPDLALVRNVTEAITRCELTHLAREPIDLARCSVNELQADGSWKELSQREVKQRFEVTR